MKRNLLSVSILFFQLLAFNALATPGGPGSGGGGDCNQTNTQGVISSCVNCTIIDGSAPGDLDGDGNLVVMADGCGPVEIILDYDYEWNQGASLNWIHGVSINAGPNWTTANLNPPADYVYMPNGLTGCCSGTSYGPGYYYDGSEISSAEGYVSFSYTGPGMCVRTWYIDDCNDLCDGDASDTGINNDGMSDDGICSSVSWPATVNPSGIGAVLPTGANDGDPSNNWGYDCTTDCPGFSFELTYCPTTTGTFTEYVSFTASADGESGCWCIDADCDYVSGFNITIENACTSITGVDIPAIDDNYCSAADIDITPGTPGGVWAGSGTVNVGGSGTVTFSYCDNIGNTDLTYTITNECDPAGADDTETFEVWTPAISNESADVTEGCGTVTPTLTADVDIAGTNTTWGGAGALVWQEGATIVTDFTVTAGNCSSNQRTFTPVFQTGCAACDVIGAPITITAFPSYTLELVNNPANCGTATANLIGTDGVTVCETVTADCPNPGDVNSTTYNWSGGTGACAYNFSGSVDCTCAGCDAEAGSITIPKN